MQTALNISINIKGTLFPSHACKQNVYACSAEYLTSTSVEVDLGDGPPYFEYSALFKK